LKDLVTAILTAHSWKWESWIYDGDSQLDACDAGDVLTFQSSGVFNYVDACEAGSPTYNYTWQLVEDNKRILFGDGGDIYPYLITNISKDRITLQNTTENEVFTWKAP